MTDAIAYFSAKLRLETDASDVYAAQRAGEEFVLVDVRGEEAWSQGRIVGAIHMPHQEIADRAPAELSRDVAVVVYCWSPGCNGGAKGALEFAKLGYSVREMIGGYEYWIREGQPVENDEGALPRVFDAQVMVVKTPVAG
jgi:rhodanese-related sulfurtransferase